MGELFLMVSMATEVLLTDFFPPLLLSRVVAADSHFISQRLGESLLWARVGPTGVQGWGLWGCCPARRGLQTRLRSPWPLCAPSRAHPCGGALRRPRVPCSSPPAPQSPPALRAAGRVQRPHLHHVRGRRGRSLRAQGAGLPATLQMAWQLWAPWTPARAAASQAPGGARAGMQVPALLGLAAGCPAPPTSRPPPGPGRAGARTLASVSASRLCRHREPAPRGPRAPARQARAPGESRPWSFLPGGRGVCWLLAGSCAVLPVGPWAPRGRRHWAVWPLPTGHGVRASGMQQVSRGPAPGRPLPC